MRVLEKQTDRTKKSFKGTYDPALDNLPIPQIVLDKTERARKLLEEHPIPAHLLKR
jgi:hypothetical protein